ncbi:MAG: TetR/AcrR family transcriptional regulator [Actinomycetota bacterium]
MPKVVDRDERRATIAAAAAEAIADEGIEQATLKSIAARAGVTTGAVTHYFSDKDDVVLAALLHADEAMRSRLDAALDLGRSPVDALLDALPNDETSRRDWLVWRTFSDAAIRSEFLRSQHRRSQSQWLDTATQALAGGDGVTPDDARLDAELVVAVVDAIGDAAAIDPGAWPIARQRSLLEHCMRRVHGD